MILQAQTGPRTAAMTLWNLNIMYWVGKIKPYKYKDLSIFKKKAKMKGEKKETSSSKTTTSTTTTISVASSHLYTCRKCIGMYIYIYIYTGCSGGVVLTSTTKGVSSLMTSNVEKKGRGKNLQKIFQYISQLSILIPWRILILFVDPRLHAVEEAKEKQWHNWGSNFPPLPIFSFSLLLFIIYI